MSKHKSDSKRTIKHFSDNITQLSRHHSSHFVIGGDYNHLDMKDVGDIFSLHNILSFPTRGSAFLDKMRANIPNLKCAACGKLPSLGYSDHNMNFMPANDNCDS